MARMRQRIRPLLLYKKQQALAQKIGPGQFVLTNSGKGGIIEPYAVRVLADAPLLYMRQQSGDLLVNDGSPADVLDATSILNVVEIAGQVGGAGQYNGVDSFIQGPAYPSINDLSTPGVGNFISMSAWIFIDSTWTTNFGIFGKGPGALTGSSSGFLWYVQQANGRLSYWAKGGVSDGRFEITTAVPTDQWVHVAFSIENGIANSGKMYINGDLQPVTELGVLSGAHIPETFDWTVGKYRIDAVPTFSGFAKGGIDEMALWGSEITHADFLRHINGVVNPLFSVDLRNTLRPVNLFTQTDYTFSTDDGDQTHTDHEGVVRTLPANCASFKGARVVIVQNQALSSPTVWTITGGTAVRNVADNRGGTSGATLTPSASACSFGAFVISAGRAVFQEVFAIDFRLDSALPAGVNTLNIIIGVTSTNISLDSLAPVVGQWYRLTSDVNTGIGGFAVYGISVINSIGPGPQVTVAAPQAEIVQGQSIQTPGEYVSIAIGTETELNSDTDCATPTGWTIPAGWAHDAGNTEFDATLAGTLLLRDEVHPNIVNTKVYAVKYTIANYSAGSVTPQIGGASGTGRNSNGTFVDVIRATADGTSGNTGLSGSGFTGSIQDYSVIEIDHGSNVDGVKFFKTLNGNTVASNVVTEATGAAIADATLDGVVLQEQVTNLIQDSEDFTAASYASAWIAAAPATSPRGDQSAQTGLAEIAAFDHVSVVANGNYHLSVYMKEVDSIAVPRLRIRNFTAATNTDLDVTWIGGVPSLAVAASAFGTVVDTGFESAGQGFYRVWMTVAGNNALGDTIRFFATTDSGFTSSSTFWGMQAHEGVSWVPTYIPTSGGAATKLPSDLNYDVANFSPGCTIVVEFEHDGVVTGSPRTLAEIYDSATNSSAQVVINAAGVMSLAIGDGAANFTLHADDAGALGAGRHKIAARLDIAALANVIGYIDGVELDTTPTVVGAGFADTFDAFYIGQQELNVNYQNTSTVDVKIFPEGLTNAEVQAKSL